MANTTVRTKSIGPRGGRFDITTFGTAGGGCGRERGDREEPSLK